MSSGHKIRVLHISPDGKLYGTERHILAIAKYSDKDRFEHVVAAPAPGNFTEELDRMGIRKVIAGREHGYRNKFQNVFAESSRRLFKEIRTGGYHIIHAHLNSFGGFIAKLAGAECVVHTRHGVFWTDEELENISASDKLLQKLKSNLFDMTIAIGKYEEDILINTFGYEKAKVRRTINGVSISELDSRVNRSLAKRDLFGADCIIAGAVGRLERQKGFELLIDAVALYDPDPSKIAFFIIGDGSLKDELADYAEIKGVSGKIGFLGYKENVLDYVNNFDINISTSLWEGMSYSVQEAMALGKPTVAAAAKRVSALPEIITDGVTGFLIRENYAEGLASAVKELAEDDELRIQMGRASRLRESEFFPESRTAEDMDSYYLELTKRKQTKTGN